MARLTVAIPWLLGLSGVGLCTALSACNPPPPAMDTSALPTTTTSAEPLFISTEPPPAAGSASQSAAPPPAPTLPASVTLSSGRTADCPRNHCWRSWLVPRPAEIQTAPTTAHPDLGRPTPVAVWQERLQPNVKLDFPRAKGLGLLGVVLQGVVTTAPSEGASLAALKPWSAFVAPGVGLTITSDASGAAVLLIAYPLEASLDQPLAALRKSEKAVYWDKRPGAFVVEDFERLGPQSWAKGAAHAWLGFEKDRSPQAYLGLLHMDGSLPVANHAHETAWEVLVPIRAKGNLTLSSPGKAPMDVAVSPGEVILIPPGTQHTYQPSGEDLLAVQLFVPPGPEQRYRDLARVSGDP